MMIKTSQSTRDVSGPPDNGQSSFPIIMGANMYGKMTMRHEGPANVSRSVSRGRERQGNVTMSARWSAPPP
ncbi:hypothetical protein ACFUC1_00680 [Pedococcus sp. NPDC057267]|uniref:hypothetical protein n=1 Tax=Pedococcus sp. NPDC057267 TaxID=3346077 RepID=UPI003633448F